MARLIIEAHRKIRSDISNGAVNGECSTRLANIHHLHAKTRRRARIYSKLNERTRAHLDELCHFR